MEQMKAKIVWQEEAVLHLIELWGGYECIFNPKSNSYHNKHARQEALNVITGSLENFIPDIDINEVKVIFIEYNWKTKPISYCQYFQWAKMHNLRSQFARETAKITKSNRSGVGVDDVYEPSAFWFEPMSFLRPFIKIRTGQSNFTELINLSNDNCIDDVFEDAPIVKRPRLGTSTPVSRNEGRSGSESQSVGVEDNAIAIATSALQSLAERGNANDEDSAFANYIKTELQKMRHEDLKDELRSRIMALLIEFKKKNEWNESLVIALETTIE